MLIPLRGYAEFLRSYGYDDDALARRLGLDERTSSYQIADVLGQLRMLHQRIERRRKLKMFAPMLERNVTRLGSQLGLSEAEAQIVSFAVILQTDPWLRRAAAYVDNIDRSSLVPVLACLLNLDDISVREAIQPRGTLYSSGLLHEGAHASKLADYLKLLSPMAADRLLHTEAEPAELLHDCVTRCEPSGLTIDGFQHLPTLDVLVAYLREALDTSRRAVNILLHGAPGSGKSELASVVAAHVDGLLFSVTSEDAGGHSIDAEHRFRAYCAAQGILREPRAMVLFDEAEDVFSNCSSFFSARSVAQSRKAWTNQLLESNPVPAIWITNDVTSMDPAFVRRFDVVLEAVLPSGAARRALIERTCGELVRPAIKDQLAQSNKLAPAVLTRAVGVLRSAQARLGAGRVGEALLQLVDGTLVAQGNAPLKTSQAAGLTAGYDPSLLTTDADLDTITKGLLRSRAGRLCLYGPPGTGKSAYARWLAQQLACPLHVQRISDLVSPYVGQTEQNLAKAFDLAAGEGALLLIDEVDGLLRDRRRAQRSWEVTAVNELLTQLEVFEGVFIASTNLLDDIDPAASRRFDLKIKFDYLRAEQAWRLLQTSCAALDLSEPGPEQHAALAKMSVLTPGDFATVERQHRFRPIENAASMIRALAAECALRERKSTSIGFMSARL